MANNALGLHALTNLSSQLKTVDRAFASAVRRNLRNGIKQQGESVVGAVKEAASWSRKIPAATGLSIRYNQSGASVRVQVDHNRAPNARPLELGNKTEYSAEFLNSHGGYRTVNGRRVAVNRDVYKAARAAGAFHSTLVHPVWDYPLSYARRITSQPTRPFFFPTLSREKGHIDQAMERVVIQTARDAGFR